MAPLMSTTLPRPSPQGGGAAAGSTCRTLRKRQRATDERTAARRAAGECCSMSQHTPSSSTGRPASPACQPRRSMDAAAPAHGPATLCHPAEALSSA